MYTRRFIVALMAATAITTPVMAEDMAGTLSKIKKTGVISLGHRESSIPFSYYDDKQQVVGYSHDIALKIVDAVKAELNLPKLEVKLTPVTSQNRISLIQNGTIDLECGSTTHTLERDKQVSFSDSIFLYGIRLLTKKNSGIKDFPDLAGKNVVTTAGTTSERILRPMNEEKKMKMNIISAKDHGESFLTLESGRAVAFMMDEPLLVGERAKAKNPNDWVVVGTAPQFENYACMLRKDDPTFKALVDKTIAALETSGEVDKLYKKWLQSPVPPKGLNLNYPPISEELKELFKHPNDNKFVP